MADVDRDDCWVLMVDGTLQSHVDLRDPRRLLFEYARRIGHVLDLAKPGSLDVVHLGGGALTLPRYVEATRPGSRQQVVEIDRALNDLVMATMPLPAGADIRTHIGDAYDVLRDLPAASADVVISDVFAGDRTPAHLSSVEFVREARRVLRQDGIYVANVVHGVREQMDMMRRAYRHVCLIVEGGLRMASKVLVASDEPLPTGALGSRCAADPIPADIR